MSNFQKNERVVVTRGEYHNRHGKVVDGKYKGFLCLSTSIKLDDISIQVDIPVGDLEYEDLRANEIKAVIKNVKSKVEQVAPKLPGVMKTVLPNHVGYLGNDIVSKDNLAANYELVYVSKNLEKAEKVKAITPEWMDGIKIDREKIEWAVKRLS